MMKEEAIAVNLKITRIGQREYFQIPLPRDTKRIIGLEYGTVFEHGEGMIIRAVVIPQWLTFLPNKVIGKLSLGIAGCENIFYQGDLMEEKNIHFGEPVASISLGAELWTHIRKKEEIAINVNGDAPFVEGFYVDSWGVDEFDVLQYQLHLYLWIEKCVP